MMTMAQREVIAQAPLLVLAEKALGTFCGPVPDEAAHAAKRCLIDWLGVVIAGAREEPTRLLRAALEKAGGTDPRRSPFFNALMLGTASHALDYDDTDYINLIHVSSTLFPALFALDTQCAGGMALLKAVISGFEAEDRIGVYLGRRLTAQGWHVSGVIGHLGSALATGLMLSLPADRLRHAMAISGTAASGLIAAFGTMSKPLQLGRAAADGLMAALLAREDFTGPEELLEGDPGFGRPFVGEAIRDWSRIGTEWGRPYAILSNSFKPHASCMITHPVIDAAVALHETMRRENRSAAEIAEVSCEVTRLAPKVAGYRQPKTGLEGKFSVAYCCVSGLLTGRATPDRFVDPVVGSSETRALLSRVTVTPCENVGEQQAIVSVRFTDGQTRRHETRMAKGNPENPLSDAELEGKFLALTEPVLGSDAKRIARDIWAFQDVADAGRWFAALPVLI
jgi:2-methylcitrate dehydratase PrpD